MKTLTRLLLLPLGLGLLASCSTQDGTAPTDERTTIDANQVRLVNTFDLLAKADRIASGNLTTDAQHDFELDNASLSTFSDGFLSFKAEAGSLPEADVAIHADWMGEDGYFGYDFGPDGYQFSQGVEVSYKVDAIVAAGLLEDGSQLKLYWDMENGHFEEVPADLVFDEDGSARLQATLYHFSKWVIGIGPPPGGETDD